MKLSENGIKLIKSFEGCRLQAYKDVGGVLTIGYGNCLKNGTLIRMADGSLQKVEDVNIGDFIAGVDGRPKQVLSKYTGISPLITVRGYDYEYSVTPNHLLVFNKSIPAYNKNSGQLDKYTTEQGFFCRKASDFLDVSPRYLMYEARASFNTEYKNVEIDPYILGTWLGDGMMSCNVELCQTDNEVLDYWKKVFPDHRISETPIGNKTVIRNRNVVSKKVLYRITPKKMASKFRIYKLINERIGSGIPIHYKYKGHKHIPNDYLFNDENTRLLVLAGLVDTDGHVQKRKNRKQTGCITFEMSIKSKPLCDDIISLSQSLGFTTKVYNTKRGVSSFIVIQLTGNLSIIPLKIKYKKDSLVDKIKPNRIQELFESGVGAYVGHTVEDNFIILDSGVITHNTYRANGDRVKEGDIISKEEADQLFATIYPRYEQIVRENVKVELSQNQFDALVSWTYNLGGGNLQKSTLLKKLNENPNDATIRDEFMKWNKVRGVEYKGLTRRRAAEADLYFTPYNKPTFEEFLMNKYPLWADRDLSYFNVTVKQMIDLQKEYAEKTA